MLKEREFWGKWSRLLRLVPGSILSAAVDVGSMLHQVAHNPQPAPGAGLVQGAVAGVVSVVHVADPPLQAVQHHLLDSRGVKV